MPTVAGSEEIFSTSSPVKLIHTEAPLLGEQTRKKAKKEYVSWFVCFAVVCGLTGLMKILKLGVTMDTVNSTLFFLSAAGMIFYIYRIFSISKPAVPVKQHAWHELN